jgi:hypothetical protein
MVTWEIARSSRGVFATLAATSFWPRIKTETVWVSSGYLKGQAFASGTAFSDGLHHLIDSLVWIGTWCPDRLQEARRPRGPVLQFPLHRNQLSGARIRPGWARPALDGSDATRVA